MKDSTPLSEDVDLSLRLGDVGITITNQRLQIARILFEKEQHLSAEQILMKLSKSENPVSKATVYNTLGLFAERGLIREVVIDGMIIFYDTNDSEHYHFYNVDNGELTDFPCEEAVIDNLPVPPTDTTTVGIDVVIRVKNS
jgi:Fur family iron response transcriptional regulator